MCITTEAVPECGMNWYIISLPCIESIECSCGRCCCWKLNWVKSLSGVEWVVCHIILSRCVAAEKRKWNDCLDFLSYNFEKQLYSFLYFFSQFYLFCYCFVWDFTFISISNCSYYFHSVPFVMDFLCRPVSCDAAWRRNGRKEWRTEGERLRHAMWRWSALE